MVYCGLLKEAEGEELDISEDGVEEDECGETREKREGLLKRVLVADEFSDKAERQGQTVRSI